MNTRKITTTVFKRSLKSFSWDKNNRIFNVCPLDGRFQPLNADLKDYFNEFALVKKRLLVELRWLEFTLDKILNEHETKNLGITRKEIQVHIDKLYSTFDAPESFNVKKIEDVVRHDIVSLVYYLRDKFDFNDKVRELLHFCLTSEDVRNMADGMILKDYINNVHLPQIKANNETIVQFAEDTARHAMLGRTHGQPANPTTLGKEVSVFAYRLAKVIKKLEEQEYLAKLSGSVGNYNAHYLAYPSYNWEALSKEFIEDYLHLKHNPVTAQTESHDFLHEVFSYIMSYNATSIDMCRDIWAYISLGYIKQKALKDEVGSSTMPHKVNPIDFENAESCLGMANGILGHMKNQLLTSRYQRDAIDNTLLRSVGLGMGYSLTSYKLVAKGFTYLIPDKQFMEEEVNGCTELLGEAVMIIMKKHGLEGYAPIKDLTRGKAFDRQKYADFINSTAIPQNDKEMLLKLQPAEYIGNADSVGKNIRKYIAAI